MATNWRVYDKAANSKKDRLTIAAKLDQSELPGFFVKKMVVGPGEGAIVVKEGEPSKLVTETSYQAASFLDQVKSSFGLGSNISIYFVDLLAFNFFVLFGGDKELRHGSSESKEEQGKKELSKVQQRDSGGGGGIAHNVRASEEAKSIASVRASNRTSDGFAQGLISKTTDIFKWAFSKIGFMESGTYSSLDEDATSKHQSKDDWTRVLVKAISADGEDLNGICHIRIRVSTENIDSLVAMLRGKRAVAVMDIEKIVRDEWFPRVLVPEVAMIQSAELRKNRTLQSEIENSIRNALSRTLGDCGLILEELKLSWGTTEQEKAELEKKLRQREEEQEIYWHNKELAEKARELDIKKAQLANMQEMKAAEARGDEEYKNLLLAGEINRDLLKKGSKVDSAQIDARIRDVTLEVEKKEAVFRLEKRKAEENLRLDVEDRQFRQAQAARAAKMELEDKEMWSMVKMQIEMATQKHDREMSVRRHKSETLFQKMQMEIEDKFNQRKLLQDENMLRMASMERLLAQGLSAGMDSNAASVMKAFLENSTEQQYASGSDEMVKARAQARGQANSLETYRQAQADERVQQLGMTQLSAAMMAAAKQDAPHMVLSDGGIGRAQPQLSSQPIVINVPPGQQAGTGAPQQPMALPGPGVGGQTCPNCKAPVQAGWKVCPPCGTPLLQISLACNSCGGAVQQNWKACPACGGKLAQGPRPCSSCGGEVQPNWRACPSCGNSL